jgi:hypothetical protein
MGCRQDENQSPVSQPANLRRAIIMGNRKKQCVRREKGPMKRLLQPLDSGLHHPAKKVALAGKNLNIFVDITSQ